MLLILYFRFLWYIYLKIEYVLGYRVKFNIFLNLEILEGIFFVYDVIKLEIKYRNKGK